MDIQSICYALYETVLSVGFGLLTVWIVIKCLERLVCRCETSEMIKQGNVAVGIFYGTIIIGVLMMVHPSVVSSVNTLQTLALSHNGIEAHMIWIALAYFIGLYVISMILSLIIIGLTIRIYMIATRRINETDELRNNNIAVSVLFALIMLGMTFFIRPSTNRLIQSLVSYDRLMASVEEPMLDPNQFPDTWLFFDDANTPNEPNQE